MENSEKKTLQYLNSKAWYRAVKVVYGLLLLAVVVFIVLLFSIGGDFEVLDIPNSKIVCQYGNDKEFLMKEIFSKGEMPTTLPEYFYFKDTEHSKKILEACEISEVITKDTTSEKFNFVPDPYRIEEKQRMQVGYLLLSLLITIGVFEAIRRIFYYVILGSIRPKK